MLDQRPVEKSGASVLVRNWNTTVFVLAVPKSCLEHPQPFPLQFSLGSVQRSHGRDLSHPELSDFSLAGETVAKELD